MTTFPAFRPNAWPLEHGEFPSSVESTLGGNTSIVRHSSDETGRQISGVQFTLTHAEWLQLIDHANEHGTHFGFDFSTTTFPADRTIAGHLWYYSALPTVEEKHADFFVVSCSFISRYYQAPKAPAATAYAVAAPTVTAISPGAATPATPTLTIPNATGSASTVVAGGSYASVGGLDGRNAWEYSTNGGSTWTAGRGASFEIPAGTYPAGGIRVRQGGGAAASNSLPVVVPAVNTSVSAIAVGNLATVTGSLTLRPLYLATRIVSTLPGWLTVYGSAAALAADAARSRSVPPESGSGVFHDPVFAAGSGLDIRLSPLEAGCNGETPETAVFPFRFRNDSLAGELIVTVYYKEP
jgi:hypothetical protein